MESKQEIITALQEEFALWEEALADMSEAQINAPQLPSSWSLKDEIAHLWAWQRISSARLQAALRDQKPEYPQWPVEIRPDTEGDLSRINDWIYITYHQQPWSSVYHDWRTGFLRFLELAQALSEKDLLEARRYPWLGEYRLMDVIIGSYEHHAEHRESLLAWLHQQK